MFNKTNFNIINEIQERADIVSVISNFIRLNKKGNNYVGICPFHPDTNPSLVVSPKKKIFKCFVCGAKGNVFSFIQQYKKVSFLEAVRFVGEHINYDITKLDSISKDNYLDPQIKRLIDLNQLAQEWYHGFLFNPENKVYLDYLFQRGLTKELIDEYGLGYATKSSDLMYRMLTNKDNMFGEERDKSLVFNEQELLNVGLIVVTSEQKIINFFIDRIIIPIRDNNGYIVGFSGRSIKEGATNKYLNTPTTKLFSKSNILFNFDKVKILNPTKLIIVEGPMDAIAYIRAGYQNVIATMGVALTTNHLNLLKSLTNLETVIVSFDNDDAGSQANIQHGKTLMENGFNTFVIDEYDKQYKDIDELLNAKGVEAISKALNNRKDFVTFLIESEFKDNKPLDELQKSVNYIIEAMLSFGDTSLLLRTKNLKLLSEKSNFEFNDLLNKFNKDEQKMYPQILTFRRTKTFKPTNDVGLDKQFVEDSDVSVQTQPTISDANKLQEDNLSKLKLLSKKLVSIYDYLISILLTHPETVDYITQEISLTTNFEFQEQEIILKTIWFFKVSNMPIEEGTIIKYIQQRSEEFNTNVSQAYLKAYKYLKEHLESIEYEHFKNISGKNIQTRLENTVYKLQLEKYEFKINKKYDQLFKLYLKNPKDHKEQINILFAEIKNIQQAKKEFSCAFFKSKKV